MRRLLSGSEPQRSRPETGGKPDDAASSRSTAAPITWPRPPKAGWAAGVAATAQIVYGHWRPYDDGIGRVVPAYGCAIAMGYPNWPSVDATVPVTIHSIRSDTGAGLRIRAQPADSEPSRHSCELWNASDPNAFEWTRPELLPRRAASLLLVPYLTDVTFERLHVRSPA